MSPLFRFAFRQLRKNYRLFLKFSTEVHIYWRITKQADFHKNSFNLWASSFPSNENNYPLSRPRRMPMSALVQHWFRQFMVHQFVKPRLEPWLSRSALKDVMLILTRENCVFSKWSSWFIGCWRDLFNRRIESNMELSNSMFATTNYFFLLLRIALRLSYFFSKSMPPFNRCNIAKTFTHVRLQYHILRHSSQYSFRYLPAL